MVTHKKAPWLVLLFLLTSPMAWALDSITPAESDQPYTAYFKSVPANTHTLQTIKAAEQTLWQRVNENVISLGVTQNDVWLKIELSNQALQPGEYVLDLHYPYLDSIEFYHLDGDNILNKVSTGDTQPFSTRPLDFPTFAFPFNYSASPESALYFKISTLGSMEVPFSLHRKDSFFADKKYSLVIYVAIFSILSVMAIYNLFVYTAIRQNIYFYYCGYCLGAIGFIATVSGYGYQYLWPESPFIQKISAIGFNGITHTLVGLFTITFLSLERFPRLYSWVATLTGCAALSSFGALALSYDTAFKISMLTNTLISLSALLAGLYVWKKGDRVARLFVLTWVTQFVMVIYTVLAKTAVLPLGEITEYIVPLSAVVVVIMLSFALADRIAILRQSSLLAQESAVKHLNRFRDLFENAIEGIFSIDTTGNWLSANPSLLRMFGHTDLEALQTDFISRSQKELSKTSLASIARITATNSTLEGHTAEFERPDGTRFWASVNARYLEPENSTPYIEGSMIDVTSRLAFEDKLNFLARHDSMTNLFNRRAFEEYLLEAITEGQARKTQSALMYLDLDQFKVLNDTCGHSAGDKLLTQLSSRLSMLLKPNQILARLGGDEFGLLVTDCTGKEAKVLADTVLETIRTFRFRYSDRDFAIGASIGVVSFRDEHLTIETLLSHADTACFMAKDLGRNRVHFYAESDEQIRQRQSEMEWVSIIKDSLRSDAFKLMYQHIKTNSNPQGGHHYEILVRLITPEGKAHSPVHFISSAERYGLMPDVDTWVIEAYFRWLKNNPEHLRSLSMASINLSGHSLGDERFMSALESLFKRYEIPPHKICFEVTESMAITRLDKTLDFIYKYKQLGCRFALDDFGTGFSSYAYLKELPVDFLKIDGFFVRNMMSDKVDLAMVKSIQEVANTIGIATVAEFVENEEALMTLTDIGITYSQGYLIHKPQALESFTPLNELGTLTQEEKH